MTPTIKKVVLTGGPCAGKSTSLSYLFQRLDSLGFRPYLIPEAATLLISSGLRPEVAGGMRFQNELLRLQLSLEDQFSRIADRELSGGERIPLLICDRGALDGKAFCTPGQWAANLSELQIDEALLLPRYDAVIHMTTAAIGAREFYTTENNPARRESADEAAAADRRLRRVWSNHSNHHVVENTHTFDTKIHHVADILCSILNVSPIPRRKSLFIVPHPRRVIAQIKGSGLKLLSETIIKERFLTPVGSFKRRLRLCSAQGTDSYFLTSVRLVDSEQHRETSVISHKAYASLSRECDPVRVQITKKRLTFFYQNSTFEIDQYLSPSLDYLVVAYSGDTPQTLPLPLIASQCVGSDDPLVDAEILSMRQMAG